MREEKTSQRTTEQQRQSGRAKLNESARRPSAAQLKESWTYLGAVVEKPLVLEYCWLLTWTGAERREEKEREGERLEERDEARAEKANERESHSETQRTVRHSKTEAKTWSAASSVASHARRGQGARAKRGAGREGR